jgi:hypothetical protein
VKVARWPNMENAPLSKQAARNKEIVAYLLGENDYRTPKQIQQATGYSRKDITRSIADIRQCDKYMTRNLPQPLRIKLSCMKKVNELWGQALYGKKHVKKKQSARV